MKGSELAKRALCIGINEYQIPGTDLRGCVNDALAWSSLLRDEFDFADSDIQVLLDSDATKKKILSGLKKLMAGAEYGDVLVFTNASHGTQVPDTDGDEKEAYDEALCPYDVQKAVITDDELRELLAEPGRGVKLTIISDSCHSGSVTRAALADNFPGVPIPMDRRVRFLNPALLRRTRLLQDPIGTPPRSRALAQSGMKHVLVSGCLDREYSYDALIGGDFRGAMSFYAIEAIRKAGNKITYKQLVDRVNTALDTNGYPQHPQLEGRSYAKDRQVFV